MSLFTEPFNPNGEYAKKLLAIAITGYTEKPPLKQLVSGIGIAEVDVDWDGSVADVWPRILILCARRNRLRELVKAMLKDENYALVRPQIDALLQAAAEDEGAEAHGRAQAADYSMAMVVGRRPFINRRQFRENVRSLFGAGGDHTMIVDGPPKSGRSYSWVLISYFTRMTGELQASLIDLSRFRGSQARPDDVAAMIAADLGWKPPEADVTAQDQTNGRVLLGWIKHCVHQHGAVCLVFDGLDGDNLDEAAVGFIGDIATAAGNDELGDSRVVLLAFGRALQNPNVDPFVLREPSLADIPLTDFTAYLQAVAADGGQDMNDTQAEQLAATLLGPPAPDPVPIGLLATRAVEVSKIACQLLRGVNG
jgi:hypothetical protein